MSLHKAFTLIEGSEQLDFFAQGFVTVRGMIEEGSTLFSFTLKS